MKKKTAAKIAIGTTLSAVACAIAYRVVKEKKMLDSFEDDFNTFDEEPEERKEEKSRKYTKILSKKI